MKKIFALMTASFAVLNLGLAQSSMFQASLTPEIAIYPKTTDIQGLSLHIWGENPQQGVALGLVNGSTGDSSGFTWGLFNYADSYTGVTWGWINVSWNSYVGWEDGWINISQGSFKGLQSGWIANYAQDFQGLQLGLINYSENLNGVQLGFVNIANNNPWFNEFPNKLATGFPILNWSF
jgi:hypothetical protein